VKFDQLPDLRRLRALDATARAHSLVAAAAQLRISQPAITYLLNRLESDLGVRLLVRGAKGTALTEQGVIFARRTKRCLQQIRSAVEHVLIESQSPRKPDAVSSKLTGTQYRSVLALWTCGGIGAASERLNVREQAVLRPLRDLERLLSTRILRPVGDHTELSDIGREFGRRLSLAAQEIWSALEEIGRAQADHRSLRIGALVLSPRLILAEALDAVLAGRPQRTVEVTEGSYEELVRLLRDGSIDIIFGALRAPPPFPDLMEEPLHEDPYVVVCRRGHPLSRLDRVGPKDLAGFDVVVPTVGLRHDVLEKSLRRWKVRPRAQVHTSGLPMILAMVRASNRLAVLSRWHVDFDNSPDILCLADLHVPHEARHVGLTTRTSWTPTPFQESFIDALRRTVSARVRR
jgi:DNA-binding transcriptional LysR family regulator